MNERLTELYRSCRSKEALASQDQYKSADVLMGTEVAKFAELIVRECVDIAYKYDEPKLSGPGMIIGNRIEEHFGVEE
jgi:hypothetical protein